jgi:hypothetical protein
MEASSPARVLVVANRTAATPKLLEVVRQRAARGRCTFTLLVPALAHVVDPDNVVVERTLPLALPLIEEAAGSPVKGLIGDSDPVRTVSEAIGVEHFEEVIVSTLPQRVSHWLHRDVPARVERLGVRVTVVIARGAERAVWEDMRLFGGP